MKLILKILASISIGCSIGGLMFNDERLWKIGTTASIVFVFFSNMEQSKKPQKKQ